MPSPSPIRQSSFRVWMFKSGQTVADALRAMRQSFTQARIDTAALDARLLVGAACKLTEEEMISQGGRRVGEMEAFRLERFAARRQMGEPVSRILGRREFWGMEFLVTPDTLDPRPDTETLVEAALDWARGQAGPLRILDLGTGTGCILISLLAELPDATGIGVDISAPALAVARDNARRLGVDGRAEFRQGSWFAPIIESEAFDLIVSNPPYIAESEMESLRVEVKNHDPRGALTDEKDGLEAYKAIYPQLANYLKPHGMAFFEMGYAQGPDMMRLVEDSDANLDRIIKDLAGHERVVALSIRQPDGDNKKKMKLPR